MTLLLLLLLDYFLVLVSVLYTPFRVRTGSGWGAVGIIAALIAVQSALGWWILGSIYAWNDSEWAILCYFLWIFFSALAGIAAIWKILKLSATRQGGPGKPPFSYRWIGHIHLALVLLIALFLLGGNYVSANSALYFVLFLGALALAFYQQDKNYKRPGIREVISDESKKPVLYLRAFKTENIGFWNGRMKLVRPYTGSLGKVGFLQPFQSLTFAEFFGKPFTDRIGPFIMLGNPHDFLTLSGGYTDYYKDSNWQQQVLDYLARSAAIVMPVVQSGNLGWELDQIKSLGYAQKLFILTRPVQNRAMNGLARFFMKIFGTLPISWQEFRAQLAQSGFTIPEQDPGAGAVLRFDGEGVASVICVGAGLPNVYVDAIAGAIQMPHAQG